MPDPGFYDVFSIFPTLTSSRTYLLFLPRNTTVLSLKTFREGNYSISCKRPEIIDVWGKTWFDGYSGNSVEACTGCTRPRSSIGI